jgi:tRNA-specific 2-thiouridylase
LSSLTQAQLQKVLLPLSNYLKPEIRKIAAQAGLPAADAAESQDICFLPNDAYGEMLLQYSPSVAKKGPIIDTTGEVVGEHQGLAFYTIGQRKGLGVYAPVPMYVLEKQIDTNTLVVGPKEQLGQSTMTVAAINWIQGEAPVLPARYDVEIRYHATPHQGTLEWISDTQIRIEFDELLRDITPGQAAVFYQQQEVMGSGIIELN